MEPEKSRPSFVQLTCLTSKVRVLSPAGEAREGEGEWGDAVWPDVGAFGVGVAGAHGSGGLEDEGVVEEDRDGVVGQNAHGSGVR